VPSAFSSWKLWQYSATGIVAGINGQADRSRFNGSLSDLLAYAGGSATVPDGGAPAAGCSTGAPGLAWLALALLARRGRLSAAARR
jgi:hypothetical protein